MKVKCDFCDTMVDESNQTCPNCGAPLNGVNRMASGEPKTIEELQQWYVAHHLPPENVTRFFIGKDIKEPRAFGIYRDSSGDFIVYKNKNTGERAVRYRGKDEAYAVNELYQKLKTEISNQKSRNSGSSGTRNAGMGSSTGKKRKQGGKWGKRLGVVWLMFWTILVLCLLFKCLSGLPTAPTGYYRQELHKMFATVFDGPPPSRGYYRYEGNDYYYQTSSWYYYDNTEDDWFPTSESSLPEELTQSNISEYRVYDHTGEDFEDTQWYREPVEDFDQDWDSGSDWSSDYDWDSGNTDWDSDW